MNRDELIEQIETVLEAAEIAGDGYDVTAKNIIATVRAALQEPTHEMYDSAHKHYEGEAYLPHGLWRAMLNASPLGEQSE